MGLGFLFFNNSLCREYGCDFSRGAIVSVVAVGLFLFTTLSLFFVKPFSPPPEVAKIQSIQKSPVVVGGEEDVAENVVEAKV